MPFLFLNFLLHLWRFWLHKSCSSCLAISLGNFLLRVVSGILPAIFFLINFIGVIFEAGNETREKIWSDFGAEQ